MSGDSLSRNRSRSGGRKVARSAARGWALVVTLVVALAFGRSAAAQLVENPQRTATRQELDIVKVVLDQEKAWNDGDLAAYAHGFKDSPDTIFIGKQISHGYAQILADYKHNYPDHESKGTLAFSDLEVHALNERFAICAGRYHLDRGKKLGGLTEGLFSLVLEKTDSGWKIVVDHTP